MSLLEHNDNRELDSDGWSVRPTDVFDNDETSNFDDELSTISDHNSDNESVPDNDFDDAFLTYTNKQRNNNLSSKHSNRNNATARNKTVIHMTVQK